MVGLDASTLAEDVFLWVQKTLDKKKDKVVFVSVAVSSTISSAEPRQTGSLNVDAEVVSTLSKYLKRAQGTLNSFWVLGPHHFLVLRCTLHSQSIDEGLPVEVILGETSNIGEALTTVAKLKKATHLVLGGSHKGGLKTIGIGSVAKYCTSNAPCSVTLVRVNQETPTPSMKEAEQKLDWVPLQDRAEITDPSLHLWELKQVQ